MPTISIEMFDGRTREQKQELARRVTDAATEVLGVDRDLVRVKFYEIRRSNSARAGVLGEDPPSA